MTDKARGFREGMVDPVARLKDMDAEGIDVAILFGTQIALTVNGLMSKELSAVLCHAVQRLADRVLFRRSSKRLLAVGLIPCQDPPAAVKELEYLAKSGTVTAMLPTNVYGLNNMGDHMFDPIYECAQSIGMTLSVHPQTGHDGVPGVSGVMGAGSERFRKYVYVHMTAFPFELMIAMMHMIGEGVFDRYPKLRVGFMEGGAGWLPFWAERFDEHIEKLAPQMPELETPAERDHQGRTDHPHLRIGRDRSRSRLRRQRREHRHVRVGLLPLGLPLPLLGQRCGRQQRLELCPERKAAQQNRRRFLQAEESAPSPMRSKSRAKAGTAKPKRQMPKEPQDMRRQSHLLIFAVLARARSIARPVSPRERKRPYKIRIGFPSLAFSYMPYYVAQEKGFYKKYNIESEYIQMTTSIQPQAVVAGNINYFTSVSTGISAAIAGLPLVIVINFCDVSPWVLVTHKDINKPQDLIGKTVALSGLRTSPYYFFQAFLKKIGNQRQRRPDDQHRRHRR